MRTEMKLAAMSVLIAAIQSVPFTGSAQVTLATPPYLQNVSTNRMVVMCESVEDLQLGVEYGPNQGYSAIEPMTRRASGGGTQFQRALLTGLQPGTTYHYRLVYSPTGVMPHPVLCRM